MFISDIVLHLMKYLPRVSDSFSDYQKPDAMTISDSVVTVTASGHGKHVGDYVCITHSRIKNHVDSYSYADGVLSVVTENVHDFTPEWQTKALLKSDSTPSINGEYEIESVVNGTEITLSDAPDTLPADAYISELKDYSVNGIFKLTYATPTQYRFDLFFDDGTTVPDGFAPDIDIEETRLHHTLRISGAASVERFIKAYEKAIVGKMWICVTKSPHLVSKSDTARTDASVEQTGFTAWSVSMISQFSVNVVIPCNSESGREEMDGAERERVSLYKTLLGVRFNSGFEGESSTAVSPESDGQPQYTETKLIYPFVFSQLPEVTESDVSFLQNTVAANGLSVDFLNQDEDNDDVIMSLSVDLKDGE